jgi:hypothetical protein
VPLGQKMIFGSFDAKDFYLQMLIHQDFRKYFAYMTDQGVTFPIQSTMGSLMLLPLPL